MAKSKIRHDEDNDYELIKEQREYSLHKDIDDKTFIYAKDGRLFQTLLKYSTSSKFHYGETKFCPIESLLERDSIALVADLTWIEDAESYKDLAKLLKDAWEEKYPDIVAENKKGRYRFVDIYYLFRKDEEIVVKDGKNSFGGKLVTSSLVKSMFGVYVGLSLAVMSNIRGTFVEYKIEKRIRPYDGFKQLADIGIDYITDAKKAEFTERGKKIFSLTETASYVSYTGQQTKATYYNELKYRSDGRIMIDPKSFNQFDSNQCEAIQRRLFDGVLSRDQYGDEEDEDDENSSSKKSEGDAWRVYPAVFGFSFVTKIWGMFDVSGVKDIEFRSDAYDKLVLEEDIKEIILALITNADTVQTTDVVNAKGNGTIFLLHGSPGVGKTLTAEAVAETLKRPLYSVSVGELGTNPNTLEDSLRDILELSTAWDAVLLLDEADVFLEARSDNDVERNAMVGVFLRLLEYHQGVLFLTTNRAHNFDPAFFSRISVAIKYPDMDVSTRKQIWDNLCKVNNITLDTDELSKIGSLNGREIRNILKVSRTLAAKRDEKLTTQHIKDTVETHLRFKRALEPKREMVVGPA